MLRSKLNNFNRNFPISDLIIMAAAQSVGFKNTDEKLLDARSSYFQRSVAHACPEIDQIPCKHDNSVKNDVILMKRSGIVLWVIRTNPIEFGSIWAKTCPGMPELAQIPCKHNNSIKNDGIQMKRSGIVRCVIRMNPIEFESNWAMLRGPANLLLYFVQNFCNFEKFRKSPRSDGHGVNCAKLDLNVFIDIMHIF